MSEVDQEAVENGKTPSTSRKNNFFSSLLCFCKWGSDNTSSATNDNSGSGSSEKERSKIKTRVSRITPNHSSSSTYQNDASSQFDASSVYENSTNYTDASESVFSDAHLPNIHGEIVRSSKSSNRKKKNKNRNKQSSNRSTTSSVGSNISSNGSNSNDPFNGEQDLNEIKKEFIIIMSGGMNLSAATAMGGTRVVTVITDGVTLSWGLPKNKPIMSIPLNNISMVSKGMPSKFQKTFTDIDIDRSFHLVLRGESKAATFLAPTSLERDALVHGFQTLLTPPSSSSTTSTTNTTTNTNMNPVNTDTTIKMDMV